MTGEQMNTITQDFIAAIGTHSERRRNCKPIVAIFRDGSEATYTTAILNLLMTDPTIDYLINPETGEALYIREEATR